MRNRYIRRVPWYENHVYERAAFRVLVVLALVIGGLPW